MTSYRTWFTGAVGLGATDGLPLVPPERAAVEAVLAAVPDRDPDEPIGPVPPSLTPTSLGAVAEQSVMAGCPPELFPLLLAALDAALDGPAAVGRGFNLAGVQATANSCAPLVIVSGAAAGANRAAGRGVVLGGGDADAVALGRALRLVLWNLGQGRAGHTDMAVTGNPSKLAFAVFESAASPFPPLHAERGLAGAASAVTVFACDGPHPVPLRPGTDGALRAIARTMSALGSLPTYWWGGEIAVVLSVSLANELAADGWAPADIRSFLYETARRSRDDLERAYAPETRQFAAWPAWTRSGRAAVPVVRGTEAIHLVVAGEGGPPAAAVLPGWAGAGGFAMTRPVDLGTLAPAPALPTGDGPPREAVPDLVLDDSVASRSAPQAVAVPRAPRLSRPLTSLLVVLNHAQRVDHPDGDPIDVLGRWLARDRPGLRMTVHVSATPTEAEDERTLAGLVAAHDAALLATGASGARSYKVAADAVQVERLGKPTVSLVTEGYESYVAATAGLLGLSEVTQVTVRAGYAGWPADVDAVGAAVAAALESVPRG